MTALAGIELVVLVAFLLLGSGVMGSVVPGVPGALLSLVGVLLYWWHTGYADPGLAVLSGLVVAGLAAVLFDWLGAALATRSSGGSTRTTVAVGVVSVLLFLVAGPVGMLVGVAGTTFAFEYTAGGTAKGSLRTAGYATIGVLASAVVQLLVTAAILGVMIVVVFT